MTRSLIVTLRPDGTVAAETKGMRGDECLDYIGALENLLEAETTESSFTAEHDLAPDAVGTQSSTTRDVDTDAGAS